MSDDRLRRVLLDAADAAERRRTHREAVQYGWSALHAERDLIDEAFRAWCRAEDFDSHPSGLGEYLRRHYSTPTEVAESLRRAADAPQETPKEQDHG